MAPRHDDVLDKKPEKSIIDYFLHLHESPSNEFQQQLFAQDQNPPEPQQHDEPLVVL